jgi:hypothetical protein
LLWTRLKAWKAVHLLEAASLAELRGPAVAVRDLLLAHIDPEDGLAVIELRDGFDWAIAGAGSAGLSSPQTQSP